MDDIRILPNVNLLFNNTRNITADNNQTTFRQDVNVTGFLNVAGDIKFDGTMDIKTLNNKYYNLQTLDDGMPGFVLTSNGVGKTYWAIGPSAFTDVTYTDVIKTQAAFDALITNGMYINQVNGLTGLFGATFGCSFSRSANINTVVLTYNQLQPVINVTNVLTMLTDSWLKNINIVGGWILYNSTKVSSLDSLTATTLPIGAVNATSIVLGKPVGSPGAQIEVTTAGIIGLSNTGVSLSITETITGDIKPTITGVNNLGTSSLLYNNLYNNNIWTSRLDASEIANLSIGSADAIEIIMGKAGTNITTAGTIILTGTGSDLMIKGTITGDIKPTVTKVNNLGSLTNMYNNLYTGSQKMSRIDTASSVVLNIGPTNANAITLGKTGVTNGSTGVNVAGTLALTGVGVNLKLAGTISGDIIPTTTGINNIGSLALLYNNVYTNVFQTAKLDALASMASGVLAIGDINATAITLGKAGVTTTTAGILALNSTAVNMTLAGTITGDIKPSVTNVDSLGSSTLLYAESYIEGIRTQQLDALVAGGSGVAGVLSIGETNATGINLVRSGITTTIEGGLTMTNVGVDMVVAGTITGDIKPTVTNVNNLGAPALLYNNAYIDTLRTPQLDTNVGAVGAAGILSLGDNNATGITLGKFGVNTSTAGILALAGTDVNLTIAGTITGDIKPTTTMVNKLGSAALTYAELYVESCKTLNLDTMVAGTVGASGILTIGDTYATGITLGKTGITTTNAGIMEFTGVGVNLKVAGTITGDIKPTVTMINKLGSTALIYDGLYVDKCKVSKLDTIVLGAVGAAGTLLIGDINATDITLGNVGVNTTTAGTVALTGVGVCMTLAGTITGDIKPTVTMVNKLGSTALTYAGLYVDKCKTSKLDTLVAGAIGAAGVLSVGTTNATGITMAKAGVTTTTAGTIALTGTGVSLSLDAGTITGDIKPTVTNVNKLGTSTLMYNNLYTDSAWTPRYDTLASVGAGVASIGDTTATGVTMGKAGVTTTTAGTLALTTTDVGLTLAGTITGDIQPTTGSIFKLGTTLLPYLSSDIDTQSSTAITIKNGALNGTLIKSASTLVDIPFKLPISQGAPSQFLTNDGVGNSSWAILPTADVSIIACLKYGSGSNQIITNSMISLVRFPTVEYTAGNINSATATNITINVAGYYTIAGNINISTSGVTVLSGLLNNNGTTILPLSMNYTGVTTDNISFNTSSQFTAGDVITFGLSTSTANDVTVLQTKSTYISATYIGSLNTNLSILDPSQCWINSVTGNDTNGTGLIGSPWASITKGFSSATYPLKINIRGTFLDVISLSSVNSNIQITTGDGAQGHQSILTGLLTTQSGCTGLKLYGIILSNNTNALLSFNDSVGRHSIQNCSFVSTNSIPINTSASFTNWLHFQDCDFTGLTGAITLQTLSGTATARFINCGLINISVGSGWTVYISGNTEIVSTAVVVGQILKSDGFMYTSIITTQSEFNAISANGLYINQVTGLTGLTGATFGCSFKRVSGVNKVSLVFNSLPPSINVLNTSLNYDTWIKNKNIAGGWIVYDSTKTTELDSITATTLPIGAVNATGLILGKAGVTTTTAGIVALTTTGVAMSVVGTVTGDIKPTVTLANKLGTSSLLYNNLYTDVIRTPRIDTVAAGTLSIGATTATGIILGKTGITTTTAGAMSLTGTGEVMTIAGTITGDIIPTSNSVNNLGSSLLRYNVATTNVNLSARLDTNSAGTLLIGDTIATGITLGKTGVTTTTAGILALTNTGVGMTLVGTVTGDIRPTVTLVNNLGSSTLLYNNLYTDVLRTPIIDTWASGPAGGLIIGDAVATSLVLGKSGVTTTTAGTLELSDTGVVMTMAGSITGDIIPTITNVNNLGTPALLYNNLFVGSCNTSRLDTSAAGTLLIGNTNATGIILGKAGLITTIGGALALTSAGVGLTIAGSITGSLIPTNTIANDLGSSTLQYNNLYTNILRTAIIDTITAGALPIGGTTATGITIGKSGILITSDGTVSLTSTGVNATLAGSITGDIMPTTTNISTLGTTTLKYNNSFATTNLTSRIDTIVAGTFLICNSNATAITLGNPVINTTTAGVLALTNTGVGLTLAGTITGDLKPTVTGFNNLGSATLLYDNLYTTNIYTTRIDTDSAGPLFIGDINASAITLGRSGATSTTAGIVALTGTEVNMTLAGTITGTIKPTITNVNNLGGVGLIYNTSFINTSLTARLDTGAALDAGTLIIGDTISTAITLGKTGITTTSAGIVSLTTTGVGMTIAGTITGDVKPNTTLINNLGTSLLVYNNLYTNALLTARFDILAAGTLTVGITTATSITLGKTGVTTTTAGILALASTGAALSIVGTITGDIKPTVTNVNSLGTSSVLYTNSYVNNRLGSRFDTLTAVNLPIGNIAATAITIGKTGVNTTTAGTLALTATGVCMTTAGTITGDIKPTVTNVNSLGSASLLYNNIYATVIQAQRFDTPAAGTLLIGDTNATAITLGKTGVNTTTAGTLALTNTGVALSVVGTITGNIIPTVTNINNLGSASLLYNTSFINTRLGSRLDTLTPGTLLIGTTTATAITLGKVGVSTTSAGDLSLTAIGVCLTLAGSIFGDVKPTVTLVNNLGTSALLYSNLYATAIITPRFDILTAGTLLIGTTNATAITLGKTGITTTTAGTIALTATAVNMTIAGSITGDIKPTVTNVNNLGTLLLTYNNAYVTNRLGSRFDTVTGSALLIGDTNATDITIGKTVVTTTSAGTIALTGTGVNLTLAGTITGNLIPTITLVSKIGTTLLPILSSDSTTLASTTINLRNGATNGTSITSAAISANIPLKLPTVVGDANQLLLNTGTGGVCSWYTLPAPYTSYVKALFPTYATEFTFNDFVFKPDVNIGMLIKRVTGSGIISGNVKVWYSNSAYVNFYSNQTITTTFASPAIQYGGYVGAIFSCRHHLISFFDFSTRINYSIQIIDRTTSGTAIATFRAGF